MGLLDLLFGSSGDDRADVNGFLAPLFGPGTTPAARYLPRDVGGSPPIPLKVSPLPVQSQQPVETQAPHPYWSPEGDRQGIPAHDLSDDWTRISEKYGFVKGPAISAALESALPGIVNGPADAIRHVILAAEL